MSIKIPEAFFDRKRKVLQLKTAIQTAIDGVCAKHEYKISYNEINAALIEVCQAMNAAEFKEDKS